MKVLKTQNLDHCLKYFAEHVRAKREEKGLTREKLSVMAGMNYVSIRRIENGQHMPSLAFALRLSSLLGIDLNILTKMAKP